MRLCMIRFLLLWTFVTPAAAQRPDSAVAIAGGTLIDGNGGTPLPDAAVVIRAGRIVAVGPRASVTIPRGARVIDAMGKFITPGFVDANVHLSIYSGLENFARYEDRFRDVAIEAAQRHLKVGVTTVRDSYGMLEPLKQARDAINDGMFVGPRILFAGNIVGWGGPW